MLNPRGVGCQPRTYLRHRCSSWVSAHSAATPSSGLCTRGLVPAQRGYLFSSGRVQLCYKLFAPSIRTALALRITAAVARGPAALSLRANQSLFFTCNRVYKPEGNRLRRRTLRRPHYLQYSHIMGESGRISVPVWPSPLWGGNYHILMYPVTSTSPTS